MSNTKLDFNEYQREAMRTCPDAQVGDEKCLASFGLGIAGEAGECADLIKKHIGHGHDLDVSKLRLELGDVLWYVAGLAHLCGLSLEDVATANVDKLKARYPNGFSHEASKNRSE